MARAARGGATVTITNVEPTMLLMKKYGSKFNAMVRDDVQEGVAPLVVTRVTSRAAASNDTGHARAVVGTFRVKRDRFPAITGFGAVRVASTGVQAGYIGFGGNWGGSMRPGSRTKQFGAYQGTNDRFIYSAIADSQVEIDELWQQALDRAYKEWNR